VNLDRFIRPSPYHSTDSTHSWRKLRGSGQSLGLAYKKNVEDTRESASIKVIELLEDRGAKVDYFDPYVPIIGESRDHARMTGRRSIEWNPESLGRYDASLILTDHDFVDYGHLAESSRLVIDTRNATALVPNPDGKVVKA